MATLAHCSPALAGMRRHEPESAGSFMSMFRPGADEPDGAAVALLGAALEALAQRTASEGPWASGAWSLLAREGVLAAFVPVAHGGTAALEPALLRVQAEIAARCLTTALVLSQWAAAVRIVAVGSADVREALLPALARGTAFTTVGISQITTSRQHVGSPVLQATHDDDGWRLAGACPWVTGADAADTIVTGAATADGRRMFFVVPTAAAGVGIEPPMDMLALSGSRTSAVRLDHVRPLASIAAATDAPRTGGLATSALALGAARAAVGFLDSEAVQRPALAPVAESLAAESTALAARLHAAARDGIDPAARDRLRADANGLVTRSAQAALTAAKGAGFVRGHHVERLARESLFFLVWSCPPAVATSLLCELAGGG